MPRRASRSARAHPRGSPATPPCHRTPKARPGPRHIRDRPHNHQVRAEVSRSERLAGVDVAGRHQHRHTLIERIGGQVEARHAAHEHEEARDDEQEPLGGLRHLAARLLRSRGRRCRLRLNVVHLGQVPNLLARREPRCRRPLDGDVAVLHPGIDCAPEFVRHGEEAGKWLSHRPTGRSRDWPGTSRAPPPQRPARPPR